MHNHDIASTHAAINDAALVAKRRFGERLLILATIPTILAGSYYAYLESATSGYTSELVFIALLCTATAFVSLAVILIKRTLCDSASFLYAASHEDEFASSSQPEQRSSHVHTYFRAWQSGAPTPEMLLRIVFHRPSMVLTGIVYGAMLGSAPIVLQVRSETPDLQRMLMFFMFLANCVTGAALYSIVTCLRQSWHLAKQLDVTFFCRRTPSAYRYSRLLVVISVSSAVYIGMCQASIVFSHFAGVWVYGYAIFAVAVCISVYSVPQIPIRRRFFEERDAVLRNIEESKQALLSGVLTPEATDQIAKLYDAETRIFECGLGLSPRSASIVTWSAVGAAMIPFAATLFGILIQKYLEMF